jgi:DNA-binding winged helix-turn-helix (wHTH) protein
MSNYTISIFGSKIFYEILNELKLFEKYKIKYYENLERLNKNTNSNDDIIVCFLNNFTQNNLNKIMKKNYPILLIGKPSDFKHLHKNYEACINLPFSIQDFEKKLISTIAKTSFKKNSFINLNSYIIDKNERKIKKNDLELQLSEKEVNFLILFSKKKKPVSRNFVLKNVWHYSSESETHTVETHIYRLRKKIFEKFGDKNFIKNNSEGYYI